MLQTTILLLGALCPAPAVPTPAIAVVAHADVPQEAAPKDPRQRYAEAASARDLDAMRALFEELPGAILFLFDGDLEGSLAVWEEAKGEPGPEARARITELHERALFAAKTAVMVTGRPIFVDYATSFVGWNAEQKASFRAGQKAFGLSGEARATGDFEQALVHAVECRELALPLGDWWGSAMGLDAEARALAGMERHEETLAAASRARLLWNQLGLVNNELGALLLMADAAEALDRLHRAHAALRAALDLFGDDPARAELEARRDALAARLEPDSE